MTSTTSRRPDPNRERRDLNNVFECLIKSFCDLINSSIHLLSCVMLHSSLRRISSKLVGGKALLPTLVLWAVLCLRLARADIRTSSWQTGVTDTSLRGTSSQTSCPGPGRSREDLLNLSKNGLQPERDEEQVPIQLNLDSPEEEEERLLKLFPFSTPINRIIAQTKPKPQASHRPTRQASVRGPASGPIQAAHPVHSRNSADRFRTSRMAERSSARALALQAPQEAASSSAKCAECAKCALILQRTYVKRVTNDGVANEAETSGNDLSSDQLMATGKRERVCITYREVNKAIGLAKQRRRFKQPADEEINSIEPSVPVIAELGELNQEVTNILSQKFDLSPDEILNGLTLIDMLRTDFWPICPLMVRPVRCDPTGRFRSFTGHCNNLRQPAWGAAQTPFVRFLAPRHPDGIQQERVSALDGSPLPSPRLVTSLVHRDHDQPSSDLSLLIMVWGQVIDHDVALAAPPRGK